MNKPGNKEWFNRRCELARMEKKNMEQMEKKQKTQSLDELCKCECDKIWREERRNYKKE